MPLIQVNAAQGALTREKQDALMSQLSDAVLRSEGADPADPAAQSLVWAFYEERPAGACYVGGQNLEAPPLCISVTTPEGALNENSRKTLVADIGAIADDALGQFEGRLNHWALLQEISEGSWGGAGQIFPLAGIQAAMNIDAS